MEPQSAGYVFGHNEGRALGRSGFMNLLLAIHLYLEFTVSSRVVDLRLLSALGNSR